jgi:hypothetical protein
VLLKTISHWQQRAPERAVLLAQACGGFAGRGLAKPYLIPYAGQSHNSGTQLTADDEDDDDEEDPRAGLLQLALGRMDRRYSPTPNRIAGELLLEDEGSYVPDGDLIVDKITGFSSQFETQTLSLRRSYWDVLFHPITPVEYAFASNRQDLVKIKRDHSEIECTFVSEPESVVAVTIGPVIGRLTHSTAIIMLETSGDSLLQMLLVDQLTGVEHRCAAFAKAHRPTHFVFDALISHRGYDIFVSGNGVRRALSPAVKSSANDSHELVWGTLRTLHSAGPASIGPRGLGSENPFHDEDEERRVAQDLRQQVSGLSSGQRNQPFQSKHKKLLETSIIVVGENCPSSRRLGGTEERNDGEAKANVFAVPSIANDRATMLEGIQLSRAVADVLAEPLSQVELVIHCGSQVDFRSGHARNALSYLARAEELLRTCITCGIADPATESYGLHHMFTGAETVYDMAARTTTTTSSTVKTETDNLVKAAEKELRDAYRLHWGASSLRSFFEHGSHIFVGSAVLDVLSAFAAPNLRWLAANTSTFCVNHLCRIAVQITEEYQTNLWSPERDIFCGMGNIPRHFHHQQFQPCVHQVAAGRALVFALQVGSPLCQWQPGRGSIVGETSSGPFDNLIPDDMMDLLHSILSHSSEFYPLAMTLIISSPLPMMFEDTIIKDYSMLSRGAFGPGYSSPEVVRILDLLAGWLAEDCNREVIIVCGGVPVGFQSTIEITENENAVDIHGAPVAPTKALSGNDTEHEHGQEHNVRRIVQVCCGPIVGIPGDSIPPGDVAMHSSSRTFRSKLRHVSQRPHVATIELHTNYDGTHRRATSKLCDLSEWNEHSTAPMVAKFDIAGSDAIVLDAVDEISILRSVWKDVLTTLNTRNSVERPIMQATSNEGQDQFRTHMRSTENELSEADMISKAVRASCKRCSNTFRACHALFNERLVFGLPTRGGIQVQESFLSMIKWVLDRMPAECKAVCPLPSSFTLRKLWEHRCSGFGTNPDDDRASGMREMGTMQDIEEHPRHVDDVKVAHASPLGPTSAAAAAAKPAELSLVPDDVAPWGKDSDGADARVSSETPQLLPQLAPGQKDDRRKGSASGHLTGTLDQKQQHHHHHHHHHRHRPKLDKADTLVGITAALCCNESYFALLLEEMIEAQALLEHFSYVHGLTDGLE